MSIDLLPFAAPLALLMSAAVGFANPGRRPRYGLRLAEAAALFAILIALFSAASLDAVRSVMLVLVSFIGWVVVRYAATYLDGEARQGAFMGWLCMTLASVLLLVQSGTLVQLVLAWVATSLFLHRLLLFYRIAPPPGARPRKNSSPPASAMPR